MIGFVKFNIHAYGNTVNGNARLEYNKDPIKKLKVRNNTNYELLIRICGNIVINPIAV